MLSNRLFWIKSGLRWFIASCLHKLTGKYFINETEYAGCKLYSTEEGMDVVSQMIRTDTPFSVVRESFGEFRFLINNHTYRLFGLDINRISRTSRKEWESMGNDGCDKRELFNKYIELYEDSIRSADVIGVWNNLKMGDAYLEECIDLENKTIVDAHVVGPYNTSNGWSRYLKGKKVVVVSPFADEIKLQYSRREMLWSDSDVLPDFNLITVKAVWYFYGYKDERFATWFDALDYMFDEITQCDYDIALVSCGMFSAPLCMKIKESGKQAIQMGSHLNRLFGLRMKRTDESGDDSYNEYWIRPQYKLDNNAGKELDNFDYW